jgi:hypothetical protein
LKQQKLDGCAAIAANAANTASAANATNAAKKPNDFLVC